MCCSHAKLAFPAGGVPYCQRTSSFNLSAPQSERLNGGFSDEDRNENIRRIGEIAALFRDAGIITLVSFISPFREMRRVARERAGEGNFVEVYVNTDLQTCMERDPKGLYKKQIKNFTGKDSGYEEPLVPELIADTKKYTAKECAEQIFDYIMM